MATWSSLTLCERADIEAEVGSLDTIIQLPDGEKSLVIKRAIDTTKGLIRDKLMTELPNIYATSVGSSTNTTYSNWVIVQGYTFDDLDTILDKLLNPSELKSAAVAGAIYQLCVRMMLQFKISYDSNVNVLADQRDHWKKEWEERLECGVRRLKIDLSGDGTADDFERQRTHNTIFRV